MCARGTPGGGGGTDDRMMASQKVRPPALRWFFRTSTCLMQACAPEKPPSLGGQNFCLAIQLFLRVHHAFRA